MASLLRRTAAGAGWMIAWRMVTRGLGVISLLVLARTLEPSDFGLLAMATSFTAAIEALSQFGLQDALVRHPDADVLLDAGFTLQLLRGAATSAIVALGAPAAAWWFSEPRLAAIMLVLAGCSLLAGMENVGIVAFRRDLRFDRQFTLLAVPRLIQVAVTIPWALATHSYWALPAGIAAQRAARTGLTYLAHRHRPRLTLEGWRALAGFSAWTWAGSLAGLVWDRCDPFVLGPRIGADGLGLYVQASELAALPTSELVLPATDALFAGFASAQRDGPPASDSRAGAIIQAPLVALTLAMVLLPLVIAISCAAADVVAGLVGPRWAAAESLVAILAWGAAFAPFGFVLGAALVSHGLVRRNFAANVAASAIRLAILIVAVLCTRRLEVVAWVSVGCIVAEGVVFLAALPPGTTQPRMLARGMARAILAAAATVAALDWLGLAWRAAAPSALPALAHCALVGATALPVYLACLSATWLGSGRPDGPEAMLLALARPKRHAAAGQGGTA